MSLKKLIIILFFLFNYQNIFPAPWSYLENDVEIRLRIPANRLSEFKKMYGKMFAPISYNWRKNPKIGYYYPFEETKGNPKFLSDNYYKYYNEIVKNDLKKPYKNYNKKIHEIKLKKIGSVYFASGSTKLNQKARNSLSKMAKKINKQKFSYINITGYTDTTGYKYLNHRIAINRSKSVANFLRRIGVDMKNAIVGSGGESSQGKSLRANRRVEITGFYNPLPKFSDITYSAQLTGYDKTKNKYFIWFIVTLLFLGVIGVIVYTVLH